MINNETDKNVKSVLQDWVMELPLRMQGTLLTGIRGCDLTPKYPLDSMERRLVGYLRFCTMNPADPREVDVEPGCFFVSDPGVIKPSALGHYPWHWLSHVVHCLEVIGFMHSERKTRERAMWLYTSFVNSFHMETESYERFVERMIEDRIQNGTVVS